MLLLPYVLKKLKFCIFLKDIVTHYMKTLHYVALISHPPYKFVCSYYYYYYYYYY